METKLKNKKLISTFEIFVMITAIFAFAYIISSPEIVSATATTTGCCPQANNGAICQNMNTLDAGMCQTSLVATSCDFYDPCKRGCCYNPSEGLCSPNSPKDNCEQNSGNWSDDATCISQSQCTLGCCVLGTQAPMTTSRECTRLSNEYGFTKSFQEIDSSGGCFSYIDLDDEGACVMEGGEYAPFDCSFKTKGECQSSNGHFYKDNLCTNINLNTVCIPTVRNEFRTSCFENKDQIYFIDSCGNKANIYDSARANDPEYWKTIIPASQSCASTPNSASCGNCDILAGSTCEQYRPGRDAEPNMGENICRDLNCNAYGKKHGESWCVSEYDSNIFGAAPVGSRFYKGICMDGEVSVEPCADFNQEICLEQNSGSFSEAQCVVNDWRTCLGANNIGDDERTYEDVKEECDKHTQCVMFNEIEGETTTSDAYEQNGMTGFPGFREIKSDGNSIANVEQASVEDIGKDQNKVIPLCVPKYTPGLQFWNTQNNSGSNNNQNSNQQGSSGMGYGGSTAETTALCSIGNFVCIGNEKKSSLFGSFNEDQNIICINGGSNNDNVPVYIDTLNERCRMLGSCGAYVNYAGELGSNSEDAVNKSIIQRMKIGASGDTSTEKGSTDTYSPGYLDSLKEKPGFSAALSDFSGDNAGLSTPEVQAEILRTITERIAGEVEYNPNMFAQYLPSAVSAFAAPVTNIIYNWIYDVGEFIMRNTAGQIISTLPVKDISQFAATKLVNPSITTSSYNTWSSIGTQLEGGLYGAVTSIVVNIILSKLWDPAGGSMTPGEKQALYGAISAVAGAYVTAAYLAGSLIALGPAGWIGLIVAVVITIITSILTYEAENKYYVLKYSCLPWEPPLVGECDKCNKNPLVPCSDYKCRSLGADCQYFNNLGEPGTCSKITDTSSATITPWPEILTSPYAYSDVQEMRATIAGVEAYTGIQFGVITNKVAECKIDTVHTQNYDEMSYSMIPSTSANGLVGYNHMIALSPFVTSGGSTTGTDASGNTNGSTTGTTSENSVATLPMATGENRYFIRCKNFAGNWNLAEFIFRVTVNEGPDATAPIITRFVPATESYVGYGFNATTVQFYVNEPSECRYSKDYNLAYNDMVGTTTCTNMAVLGEWPCYAILNLTPENNNYYFKCKDTAGNKNENAYEYSLNSCQSGLSIIEKSPSGEIKIGTQTANIELYLKTSGCIEGGKATCSYNLGNGPIEFLESDSTEHLQVFTTLPAGNYNIPVSCNDIAGNTASSIISFNLTIADTAPIVIFASKSGGTLKVITNEPAQCKYAGNNTNSCSFNFEEGIVMTGSQTIHTTTYENEKTYYIKCRNVFNITNSDCGIIVRPGE